MTTPRLVLVVDDDAELQKRWKTEIGTSLRILSAFTPEEALQIFDMSRIDRNGRINGSNIGAIVVDDCIPDGEFSTLPVIEHMRRHFGGPIIAASNHYEFQTLLVQAGCNRSSKKNFVPEAIFASLGLLLTRDPNDIAP